jgi:predicted amidohydrolase YtcJ
LRQGVTWHDGKPFTAKDVVCTWDLLTGKSNEKLRVNPRKSWYRNLEASGGTDATRVASYNPWVSLAWLVTGKTVGGLRIYPRRNCLDRETALRMWTEKATWFSNEEGGPRFHRTNAGTVCC